MHVVCPPALHTHKQRAAAPKRNCLRRCWRAASSRAHCRLVCRQQLPQSQRPPAAQRTPAHALLLYSPPQAVLACSFFTGIACSFAMPGMFSWISVSALWLFVYLLRACVCVL